jgi:hypothetical protein
MYPKNEPPASGRVIRLVIHRRVRVLSVRDASGATTRGHMANYGRAFGRKVATRSDVMVINRALVSAVRHS